MSSWWDSGLGGAQRHLRAGGRERAHEVRRLGGHVHAGADAHAVQGLLALEALADGRQHGHVARRPLDAGKPCVGKVDVFDVVALGHGASFLCYRLILCLVWRRLILKQFSGKISFARVSGSKVTTVLPEPSCRAS